MGAPESVLLWRQRPGWLPAPDPRTDSEWHRCFIFASMTAQMRFLLEQLHVGIG